MRNAAFVFSWLFFLLHILLLVAIGAFFLLANISGICDDDCKMMCLIIAVPAAITGILHHSASLTMVRHPIIGTIAELTPAILIIALGLATGVPVFILLSIPHLLVGTTILLSLDWKPELAPSHVRR